ncbi:hypothetical protein [Hanstruepera marina]|uniref:hypothetical protein n=1 Tax=Hanstruepera marina TaxID=2873265 RepID=UPI001CA73B88|nr:hypothetical protein [Hanstruepera marina]
MADKFITVKEVTLKNNCPECYNNEGLQLTFKQKFIESNFYKSLTTETKHILYCNTCKTTIYPVSWTDDIERVVKYHQRAFVPKKASFKLNKKAWTLIGVTIALIIAGIVLFLLKDQL